ncbi:Alpha/Beta hydrolase protein [Russula compacta]|nr:Alpha/Beta hydrolase protein [Russula compacta]
MGPSLLLLLLSFSAAVMAFVPPQSPVRKRERIPEPRSASARAPNPNATRRSSNRFANPKAHAFYVNGNTIPLVNFDAGDSWAGLLPISSHQNETRQLFFWYYPPTTKGNENDLIFWTNGGPGCSSLEGFLQENGPISWQFGQAMPTLNPYSWTNLGHMLWVEQPVGTGFSQGVPNIQNETELAAQLVGFLHQFFEVFAELKGKNFYLTGESYAGIYLPCQFPRQACEIRSLDWLSDIADYIYSNPNLLDLKVEGLWLGSPAFSETVIAAQVPAVNFVHKNQNVFPFNQSFLAYIDDLANRCNYDSYLEKYLTYPPPPAPFPLPGTSTVADPGCDAWTAIFEAVLLLNPAFNVYRIFDMPPILWDVLGFPGSAPQIQVSPVYFNRPDVKAAIHAPENVQWTECATESVFVAPGDTSPLPSWGVLPKLIDRGTRTVIATGLADFVLISEGTRIGIQNMTWGGKQGFRSAPRPDSFVIDRVGALGTVQSERGLTLYEVPITGHMIPQFNPPAAFQTMEYLLGVRPSP